MDKSFEKITLGSVNSFFLTILSFFYLTKHSLISIIIISIPIAVECIIMFSGRKIAIYNSMVLAIGLIGEILIWQLMILSDTECFSFLFTIIYFIVSMVCFSNMSEKMLKRRCEQLLLFAILMLIIDTIYRFTHPVVADYYQGVHFYLRYKGPGILYVDSNNTGMLVLALIGLCWYLKKNERNMKFIIIEILLFILLVLTFSRAAILACIIFGFLFSEKVPKCLKIGMVLTAGIFLLLNISLITGDVSTSEKLQMIKRVINYYQSASISKIVFGIGFANSIQELGLFTHIWPLTFGVESGVLGFCSIVIMWFMLLKESMWKSMYVVFPCLLAGLSFFPLLLPYFYCIIALIINLEKKRVILIPCI